MLATKTKLIYLACMMLFYSTASFSQAITFEKGNLKQVQKKAQRQQKFIFLQFESTTCDRCNEVANEAFNNPKLASFFNDKFVALQVNPSSKEGSNLTRTYSVSSFPASLFLNENGDLLYHYTGSTNNISDYLKYAEIALSKRNEKPIAALEKEYEAGNRNLSFLESYISRKKEINQPVDSLLNEYVSLLQEDSLSSYDQISFVLKQAPIVDSKAFNFIHSHENILVKIYQSMNFREASFINNEIITKSLNKAIKEKNRLLAIDIAKFTQRTWGYDKYAGQKAFHNNLLQYYKGIHDTAAYFAAAEKYYDFYYMSKNPDSLKSSGNMAFQKPIKISPSDSVKTPSGFVIRRQIISFNQPSEYGSALNNGAWCFYELATNHQDLEKALTWSKCAIDSQEKPEYLDTYAHLLYKLNRKQEAISWEQKAIDIIKSKSHESEQVKSYILELKKMKNNSL